MKCTATYHIKRVVAYFTSIEEADALPRVGEALDPVGDALWRGHRCDESVAGRGFAREGADATGKVAHEGADAMARGEGGRARGGARARAHLLCEPRACLDALRARGEERGEVLGRERLLVGLRAEAPLEQRGPAVDDRGRCSVRRPEREEEACLAPAREGRGEGGRTGRMRWEAGSGRAKTQLPGVGARGLAAHVFVSLSSALASRSPERALAPAVIHFRRAWALGGAGVGAPAGTVWGVPELPSPIEFCGVAGASEALRSLASCASTLPSTRPCCAAESVSWWHDVPSPMIRLSSSPLTRGSWSAPGLVVVATTRESAWAPSRALLEALAGPSVAEAAAPGPAPALGGRAFAGGMATAARASEESS